MVRSLASDGSYQSKYHDYGDNRDDTDYDKNRGERIMIRNIAMMASTPRLSGTFMTSIIFLPEE